MGRLENIIERNRHPYRSKRFAVEVPAILLLIVLGLLVFTNLAVPPTPKPKQSQPAQTPGSGSAPGASGSGEHRVDGVLLLRSPKR